MATENFEMNGDADRNGETEVRKGNTGARYEGLEAIASSCSHGNHLFNQPGQSLNPNAFRANIFLNRPMRWYTNIKRETDGCRQPSHLSSTQSSFYQDVSRHRGTSVDPFDLVFERLAGAAELGGWLPFQDFLNVQLANRVTCIVSYSC